MIGLMMPACGIQGQVFRLDEAGLFYTGSPTVVVLPV